MIFNEKSSFFKANIGEIIKKVSICIYKKKFSRNFLPMNIILLLSLLLLLLLYASCK